MNVLCPKCQALFRVDPERVPSAGARVRCARCNDVFLLTRQGALPLGAAPAPAGQAPAPAGAARPAPAPAAPVRPPADTVAQQAMSPRPTPAPPVQPPAPPASPAARATVPPSGVAAPAGRPSPQSVAAAPAPARPTAAAPAAAAPAPGPMATAPAKAAAAPAPAPVAAPGAAARPRRSFAAQDPDARAQRIARALVSDIVAYHPERRDKSLASGTLRGEFREEIVKSWEEYVAQVGAELAKKTPHFRNALNEILARGQSIF